MKPRSRSEWIAPAASGALAPLRTSHARVSSSPVVRNVMRSRARYEERITRSSPSSSTPNPASSSFASSGSSMPATSDSSDALDRDRVLREPGGEFAALLHVRHDDPRLQGEGAVALQQLEVGGSVEVPVAQRLLLFEQRLRAFQHVRPRPWLPPSPSPSCAPSRPRSRCSRGRRGSARPQREPRSFTGSASPPKARTTMHSASVCRNSAIP